MITKYKIQIGDEIIISENLEYIEGFGLVYETIEEQDPIEPRPYIAPITPMYLRLVLKQMGLLAPIMVELEKPENETKLIAFEYALEFKRDHPFITQLGQSLGMTETQIDTLFIQANILKMAIDG
jgi:hypothetical protein